ncbi:MAG: hypothetical protein ACOC20_03410 [Oceanicaulis sp.]
MLTIPAKATGLVAVSYIGGEREPFSGREYAGRTRAPADILAGGAGGPPRPPLPEPDPESEPGPSPPGGRDTVSFVAMIRIALGQFAALDGPRPSSVRGADLAMADAREGATFFTVGETRLGDPFRFSSMSLERRCRNARDRGRLESGGVAELALRRDAELCFETVEGTFGPFS